VKELLRENKDLVSNSGAAACTLNSDEIDVPDKLESVVGLRVSPSSEVTTIEGKALDGADSEDVVD